MLHFSTGFHHRTDSDHNSSQHVGFTTRAITMAVAGVIRDSWFSVGALAFALWAVTDLGTNVALVVPLLAALAVLVNAVLNPAGAEVFNTMDATDERV